jgi:cell division septation protein DedD
MRDYEEKSYYEIQLDNKQLILVFLSGLVLCVLIFVLGVMVGKGQKEAEMASMTTARPEGQVAAKTETDLKPPEQPKPNLQMDEKVPSAPKTTSKQNEKANVKQTEKANVASTKKQTRTAPEQYSFYDLDKKDSSNNDLEKPATKSATTVKTKDKADNTDNSTESTSKSGGIAYTVQVMATASKAKADERAASLRASGYKPFVDQVKTQSGVVYKVRVGKFSDSNAARAVASKLKEDLKLVTWVAPLE